MAYATYQDVVRLKRDLSTEEISRLTDTDGGSGLLSVISATLRNEATKRGKDLDAMIEANPDLGLIAMSVTCDIAIRELDSSGNSLLSQASQMSESAMGYSVSYTTPNAGGGLYIKNAELKRLGLLNQQIGLLEFYPQMNSED